MRVDASGTRLRSKVRAGSIMTSFTEQPEQIRILGDADTLHVLFSPELASAYGANSSRPLRAARSDLQVNAVQALVATSLGGTDAGLEQTIHSVAKLIVEGRKDLARATGGLAPTARRVMLNLLEERLCDGISVRELASAANLSLHHFIKVCRTSEGLTPHALLVQKRIQRSIELLLNAKASVEDIAIQVGFSSPSHFISVFHRLVGVTPFKARRAARQ